MSRKLAWFVPAFSLALVTSAVAREAHAQSLQPPPPMGQPQGYPGYSGYPGGSTPPPPSSDESDDSGLGLEWVYLNAEAGGSFVDMQSFSASSLGITNKGAGGPAFGFGGGVRLLFFTLGVRARDLVLSDIGNLWMLNLEAAFHTRIWRIDPYFGLRGGYNFVGSLSSSSGVAVATGGAPSDVSVHGFNVGPMFGIDFYLAKIISIGADVDAQFLFFQRPAPPLPAAVCPAPLTTDQCISRLPPDQQTLYKNSGSSAGFGSTIAAHVGIHF